MSVSDLINLSVAFRNDLLVNNDSSDPFDNQRIRGGPAWAYPDRYTIDAETDDPVANGPPSVNTQRLASVR